MNRIKETTINGNTFTLDQSVWYINEKCDESPVRQGVIEFIDSDCIEVMDEYLGDVTVDLDKVFRTETEAKAALNDNEREIAMALMEKAMDMMAQAMSMLKRL
ncbi:MAG: hypothetical protein HDQ88_02325 [Clostridia bacterium]|nr:hypothetical protein [Clostridia bacterium]